VDEERVSDPAGEEWRPFLDGAYEVSNLGNVRRAKPGRKTYPGKPLRLIKMKIGYMSVHPVVDGKNVTTYVHRLVAAAFIGPCPPGASVNHIDGVKTNNVVSNLEYVTHAENMAHAARTGLSAQGERHGNAKLTNAQAAELRARRATGESLTTICRDFGISKPTASMIANGHRRK
jgi:hypothetical protein